MFEATIPYVATFTDFNALVMALAGALVVGFGYGAIRRVASEL